MRPDASRAEREKAFFAVASLGRDRWYWVVWPSLEVLQTQGPLRQLADGVETSKAEAVERALEVAGIGAARVAARYAEAHHRQLSRERRAARRGQRRGSPAPPEGLEFLYRDVRDETTGGWHSVPHRVIHRTRKHVYVEQRAYDPERLTGSWLDHGSPTYRLSRAMLEREGYAYVPVTADVEDPLFFTTAYPERAGQYAPRAVECLTVLGLSFPRTLSEVRAAYRRLVQRAHPDHGGSHEEFLALRSAYEKALDLCRHPP